MGEGAAIEGTCSIATPAAAATPAAMTDAAAAEAAAAAAAADAARDAATATEFAFAAATDACMVLGSEGISTPTVGVGIVIAGRIGRCDRCWFIA